jgi:hypothetical protein
MAISLAFGVLFATFITLFLVPTLYLMLNDWLILIGKGEDTDDYDDDPVPLLPEIESLGETTPTAGS